MAQIFYRQMNSCELNHAPDKSLSCLRSRNRLHLVTIAERVCLCLPFGKAGVPKIDLLTTWEGLLRDLAQDLSPQPIMEVHCTR